MRLSSFAAAAGAAVLLYTLPASANGRFPASNQFVFSPTNSDLILLRATYGILPSTDDGASWSFLCEDSLGIGSASFDDPAIGLTMANNLVAGVPNGLDVSTDLGCNWSCQTGPDGGLAGQSIADIAVDPANPSRVVALTSTYVLSDSSTTNTYSQVFQTTDDGATWSPLGPPIDPTVVVQTIDVAKTDPNRVYVSGTRNFGVNKTASLFMWTAASGQWLEQPIADFDNATEDSIYIGAVDPTDADRVYLRTSGVAGGGQSRLFVTSDASSDAGAEFTIPSSASFDVPEAGLAVFGELLGFALSPDGSKVYVGTKESGLWVASSSDLVFQQTNSHIHVECLATRGDELWACSDANSGFVAGVSTDDGVTFTPKLCDVTGLKGPIACAPNPGGPTACMVTGNSSQCSGSPTSPYETLCTLDSATGACVPCSAVDAGADGGAPPPADAGASMAAPGGDAGSAQGGGKPPQSSCGCSVVGGRGAAAGGLLAGVGLAFLAARRKRRPRREERS